jgi:hypothetical protein
MNKIIWIVNNCQIENYLLESIVKTLDLFPHNTIEVFIENKKIENHDLNRLKSLKSIDIHFKSFKKSPFSFIDLSTFKHPRLKIIAHKENLSTSEWVIFANNLEYDFSFYETLSEKGLLAFDQSIKELINSILSNKKELSVNFKLKTKGETLWKTISNMSFNVEKGILNTLEKKAWLYPLSLSKFLLNQNDFTIVPRKQDLKISTLKFTKYYLKLLKTIVKRKLTNKERKWKISFKKDGGRSFILQQPKGSFWADPFLIKEKEFFYLFIEELNSKTKLGEIACVKLDNQLEIIEKKTILSDETHFSFPNVFLKDNQYYMLPENSEKNNLQLYKATNFPYEWKVEKTLMENCKLLDAIWIFHDNLYWMFANKINDYEYDNNDNLYLYYTDDLLNGNWKSHPQNPIVNDSGKARNAGNIFIKDNKMYRPSQNCSETYGANIVINEIIELSTQKYVEVISRSVFPPENYVGLHTFNSVEGFEVYDYLKEE